MIAHLRCSILSSRILCSAFAVGLWLGFNAVGSTSGAWAQETGSATAPAAEAAPQGPLELAALPPHTAVALVGNGDAARAYLLPRDGSVVFSAPGPAVIELSSRAVFTDDRAMLGYALVYRLDDGDDHRIDVGGIDRDTGRSYRSGVQGHPAFPLRHRIELPEGWHSLEIKRGDVEQAVTVRAKLVPGEGRSRSWRPFEPLRPPPRVEVLAAGGASMQLYRFNEEQALRLQPSQAGLMRVRIYSEHSAAQMTPYAYRIEVRRDGKPFRLYQLLAQSASQVRMARGNPRLGALRELIFAVDAPEGRRPTNYLVRPAIGSGRSFLASVEFVADAP